MRTTVRLSDALMTQARKEAARRGVTFTSLVEEGLRLVLAGRTTGDPVPDLPVCTAGGGTRPGIDLNDSSALLDAMEGTG